MPSHRRQHDSRRGGPAQSVAGGARDLPVEAAPVAAVSADTPELVLGERYRLGTLLGVGPASRVHHAHDALLGREVAVKVLRGLDQTGVRRAVRAAQAAARVDDPRLMTVLDVDTGETPFVVLTVCEGRPLPQVREHLTPESAVTVVRDVLAALVVLHDADLVHRDVRADNVCVDPSGRAVLTSAGLTEAAMDPGLGLQLSDAHPRRGRPAPSPEQELWLPCDTRSDVHAAGVLLHELLPEPSEPVREVIRRATAEDPRERQHDGRELADAFAAALALAPAVAPAAAGRKPAPPTPAPRPARTDATEPLGGASAAAPASRPAGTAAAGRPGGASAAGDQGLGAGGPVLVGRAGRRRRRLLLAALVAGLVIAALALAALLRDGGPGEPGAASAQMPGPAAAAAQPDAAQPDAAQPDADADATVARFLEDARADPAGLGTTGADIVGRLEELDTLTGEDRAALTAELYGAARVRKATGELTPLAADALAAALRPELTNLGVAALVARDPAADGGAPAALAERLRAAGPDPDPDEAAALAADLASAARDQALAPGSAVAAADLLVAPATGEAVEVATRDIGIPGTQSFTDTGIDLPAGAVVAISASGEVFHNPGSSTGPAGVPGPPGYNLLLTVGHAAVIGRVGDGEAFPIGAGAVVPVTAAGRLYLGINDTGVANNTGAFVAQVRVSSP